MNGKKAKKLRRQAIKLTAAAPGYLGLKNRTVYKKNKEGQTFYDKVLGTIICHPESMRARYQKLKKIK